MSINPNQGQNPDPTDPYGGYSGGYTPPTQPPYDPTDPYANPTSGQQGTNQNYQQAGYDQQQQQQYYQPPLSATRQQKTYDSQDATSLKMSANTEAFLSYLFWWVSGLFFFVLERKNRFVRFCAAQSFLFLGGSFVLYVILRLITIIPIIGFLLSPILNCLVFVVLIPAALVWLFLMLQAYRGVKVKLPIVGDYAERLVDRFSRKKTA